MLLLRHNHLFRPFSLGILNTLRKIGERKPGERINTIFINALPFREYLVNSIRFPTINGEAFRRKKSFPQGFLSNKTEKAMSNKEFSTFPQFALWKTPPKIVFKALISRSPLNVAQIIKSCFVNFAQRVFEKEKNFGKLTACILDKSGI